VIREHNSIDIDVVVCKGSKFESNNVKSHKREFWRLLKFYLI